MYVLLVILFIFILIGWSIMLRVSRYRTQLTESFDPSAAKASPLSMAVQDLVSTAGGVYLSLIMLTSFLRINIPERINLACISMDPMALLAIILAILQPFFLKLIDK